MKNVILLAVIVLASFSSTQSIAQEEDLRVLSNWLRYSDASNALYHYFCSQAIRYLDERAAEIAKLNSLEDWRQRQQKVRQVLQEIVGPFPKKTPLNARIVGSLQKDGFRVEKIIYESQPKFYVTACLFLPDRLSGKTPAVIYCIGHSIEGFRLPTYQHVIINLVKKGFIVFTFDPVGQGERLQYYDPELNESKVGMPVMEHSYPGAQCFIAGSSQTRYMIWDGIRAVDYLLTRKEVDPNRIGITGRSGGGTQSAYIAAFDDRIYAVAPECYITSLRRLYESIGPQDAEQNFYRGVAGGIDHADFLEVRAPRPALILATTRDFFSIQGARETVAEAGNCYQAFGKADNLAISEDDAGHASTKKNREATYAFFQKYLNLPGSPADEPVSYLLAEELQVTSTGQVANSLGGESVFSINKVAAEELWSSLKSSRQDLPRHLEKVREAAPRICGYQESDSQPNAIYTGRYQREGYVIEKYCIQGEADYPIPFLLMLPDAAEKHPVVLYLSPQGKSAEAGIGQELERFLKKGYAVLAPDLIGTGELGPGDFTGDSYSCKLGKASYNIWFAQVLLGRSIVGLQAGDVSRLVQFLKARADIDSDRIAAVARAEMCPTLLHAAAFNKSISKIALIEPLISYRSMIMNRYYKPQLILTTVANSLQSYDLPDLAASLAPRGLLVVNMTDQLGKRAEQGLFDSEYGIVHQAYEQAGAKDKLKIRFWESFQNREEMFRGWVE